MEYIAKTKAYQAFEAWFDNKSDGFQVAFIELSVTIFICSIGLLSLLIVSK